MTSDTCQGCQLEVNTIWLTIEMLIGSQFILIPSRNVNCKYIQSDTFEECQLEINTIWSLLGMLIGSKYDLTPDRIVNWK